MEMLCLIPQISAGLVGPAAMGWDGMDGSMAGSSLMAVGRQHLESTTIES